MLYSIRGISKSYGEKLLFDKVSFTIENKDKIGLIGINGSGKSTLLKIISEKEIPDEGEILNIGNAKISYLAQIPDLNPEVSVLESMFENGRKNEIEEFEAKSILAKLGLDDFSRLTGTLSGGEKRRLMLARALVKPADLLILDEPTNHLDGEMILWLENYLKKYTKAILMVTHDRYFLERTVNKILELDSFALTEYEANYSRYLELKVQRAEENAANRRKAEAYLRKELEWAKRGPRARGSKDRKRLEKLSQLKDADKQEESPAFTLYASSSRLGNKTIVIDSISKSYQTPLIKDFSLNVPKDARIGIVGKNASGKTTLLKMIAGEILPDKGTIEIGETVRIGYFAQEDEDLDDSLRIIEYVKEIAPTVKYGKTYLSAVQMVENFLFPNPYAAIGTLSGGEKRRLTLLSIVMKSPNILLLDEPTNNLDIETISILEEYLDEFEGAVIVSSHDRYFLDRAVDRFYVITEGGILEPHIEPYSEYLENKKEKPVTSPKKETPVRTREKAVKLTFREEKEYAAIENEIAELEQSLKEADMKLQDVSGDYARYKEQYEVREKIRIALDEKIERWSYLSDIYEKSQK